MVSSRTKALFLSSLIVAITAVLSLAAAASCVPAALAVALLAAVGLLASSCATRVRSAAAVTFGIGAAILVVGSGLRSEFVALVTSPFAHLGGGWQVQDRLVEITTMTVVYGFCTFVALIFAHERVKRLLGRAPNERPAASVSTLW